MIYISKDRQIHVVWSIFRGTSDVHEDFSRALVKVFLIGNYEKYLLEAVAEGGNLVFDIPQGFPEGAYSLEAIWVKNYNNLLPCSDTLTPSVDSGCRNQPLRWPFKHPHDHRFNDRCIMRSRKDYVFALTEYDSESTFYKDSGEAEIKIRSAVATYGYDGLSAYEIAVLRGDFNGTEGEYLDSLKFKLEVAKEHKLGGITAVAKTDDETEEVKVDPETGRLYVKPGGGALSVATEAKLGGIKAATKTDNETVEAKIGLDGKLYVPKGGEELKTATETTLGGIKAATKTSLETQEVKIDPVTGKLYTQPGGEGGVEIVNNPDEEDLHSVEQSADVHVLQFADKEYNASAFSGLGRVYLRKNISGGKNVLTQAMMSKSNTRYIIQYDYDLDGETITVPEGCELDFQGGSLNNGAFNGNGANIRAEITTIFGDSLNVNNNWNIDYAYPEWFGAKKNADSDSYQAITKAFSMNKHVKLGVGTYYIGHPILLDSQYKLEGEFDKTVITTIADIDSIISAINLTNAVSYGFVRNIKIDGNNKANYGIKCNYVSNGTIIENITIQNCVEAGLYISKSWYAVFRNIRSWGNKYGLYLDNNLDEEAGRDAINGVQFSSCWFNHNEISLYHTGIYGSAISFSSCTFENASGECEIKVDSLYNDLSLYSCYIETNTILFKINGIPGGGFFNLIGGLFKQKNDDCMYGQFLKLKTVTIINCSWQNSGNNSSVESLFESTSETCFVVGNLPFTAPTFNEDANVIIWGSRNDWNQSVRGQIAKVINAGSISALTNESKEEESKAVLQVGASQLKSVDGNYGCYRLKFKLNKTTNTFDLILSTNYSNTENELKILSIGQWGDIVVSARLKGLLASGYGDTSSRPKYAYAYRGMSYYDTDLKRPLWLEQDGSNGKWVDANGFIARKTKGITADRPSDLEITEAGFLFYDTTLRKMILWNGSAWVNLDGTALE